MSIRVLVTLDNTIHKKLVILAKKNFITTTAFMRQILSEAAEGKNNSDEILKESIVKKRKKSNHPIGNVKEIETGLFRDTKGNLFTENKRGEMIPYDEDDDPSYTDI